MSSRFHSFTSESVSEGHPDKLADQISDAVLDAYLREDPHAKVACECLITTGSLIIAGEVSSSAHVDAVHEARGVLERVGYDSEEVGFNFRNARYLSLIHEQTREIGASVADGGAGDQGLMFGYACDESPERMPLAILLSHRLVRAQADLRRSGEVPWLRPDAKSQVTLRYENGRPVGVEKVVFSTQHAPEITQQEIRDTVIRRIIRPVLDACFADAQPEYLVNPSGGFTVGGPHGDTGLTGRKIIVDTYGGSCPHGGGAFSGKDPTKVDRSAAYAARHVANHIVASGAATKCTIQLSYAIGVVEPTSVHVNTHGTGAVEDRVLESAVREQFDLTPPGIIRSLDLKRPIYLPTAAYGHFGRADFPWERIDPSITAALAKL